MSGEDGNDQSQSLPVDKSAGKKSRVVIVIGSGVVRGQAQCGRTEYVPICIPWSGQGKLVCGVAGRDSIHEEYCRAKKKKKKVLNYKYMNYAPAGR